MNGKYLLLLPIVLLSGCSGKPTGTSYGTAYGSPLAQLGTELPKGDKFFEGDAVSLLPEVKPAPVGNIHKVRLDVTHKVVEVFDNVKMGLWSFGGDVPGPVIHVRQGDKVIFTLVNRSSEQVAITLPMPHSIDFHAAMVSPQDKYRTIDPLGPAKPDPRFNRGEIPLSPRYPSSGFKPDGGC